MVSRYAHVVAPIHSDGASRLDLLLWSSPDSATNDRNSADETNEETKTSNAGAQVAAGPAFDLVILAVAAGFEPAEAFTSRAFEARSLGRSDTPPPVRLPAAGGKGESVHHGELSRPVRTLSSVSAGSPSSAESGLTVRSSRIRAVGSKRIARQSPSAGGEEVAEQRAALGFENTSADLDAMVEAGIAYDVPE